MTSWDIRNTQKIAETNREDARIHYSRKWKVAANIKKWAIVVCNEDEVNPVNFSWKWKEDSMPIEAYFTHLGVEISKDYSWDTHIHIHT